MNMKAPDHVGEKYKMLTLVTFLGRNGSSYLWDCRCDCGNMVKATLSNVKYGTSHSCGCFRKKNARRQADKRGWTKHGLTKTAEHQCWKHIIQRCTNPKTKDWKLYGGRGISVCDKWKNSFSDFLKDVGKRPSPTHSIDRIDVNGNYEPGNCRWATPKEQRNNQRKPTRFSEAK